MNEEKITISLEEYKELLIIKGKYQELKSQYSFPIYNPSKITYRGNEQVKPYKITCVDTTEDYFNYLEKEKEGNK